MLQKIKVSALNITNVRGLVLGALLVALYVVLGFFKIYITPDNRLSLTFIAVVVAGYVMGPVPAMVIGGLGDLVGFMIFPTGGAYFPGFTISAALSGLIYGLCLYKRPLKQLIWWIILSRVLITVGISMFLNTVWNAILYRKAVQFIVIARVVKALIALPFQVAISFALVLLLEKTGIRKQYQ